MQNLFNLTFIISIGASVALHGLVLASFNFESNINPTQAGSNLVIKLNPTVSQQQGTNHKAAAEILKHKPVLNKKAKEIKATKNLTHIKKYTSKLLPIEAGLLNIEKTTLQNTFKLKETIRTKIFENRAAISKVAKAKENYINSLRTTISNNQYYPVRARNMRIEGYLKIEFIIYSNGKIEEITVKESSGKSILDRAAKNSVVKIGQYKPFPDDIGASFLSVVVPMKYKIY